MNEINPIDQNLLHDNKANLKTNTTNKSLCDDLTIKRFEEEILKLNGEVLNAKIQNQKQTSEILSLKLKLERKNSIERELVNSIQEYRDEIDQLKKDLNKCLSIEHNVPQQDSPQKEDSITIIEADDIIYTPRLLETTAKNDDNSMEIDFPFDLLSSFRTVPTGIINKGKQKQSGGRSKIQNFLLKLISKKFNMKTAMDCMNKSKENYIISMKCSKFPCNYKFSITINVKTKKALISYNDALCGHQVKLKDNLLLSQLTQKLGNLTNDEDEDKFEFNYNTMRKVFAFQDLHLATCDACLRPIFGNRHRCIMCVDYDLCWLCRKEGYHNEHNFKIMTNVNTVQNKEYDDNAYNQVKKIFAFQNLHNFICDSCSGPIFGKRYKCQECEDYDLCQLCKENGVHDDMSEHEFKVNTKNCSKKAFTNDLNNEYFEKLKMMLTFHSLKNFVCDGCSGPIFGNKYKCKICSNYGLCHHCKTRGVHSEHSFYTEK